MTEYHNINDKLLKLKSLIKERPIVTLLALLRETSVQFNVC